MEPYNGNKDLAIWSTIESSSGSSEDDDEGGYESEEDPKLIPKGYYKMKIPIKKIYSTILIEEDLIPE